MNSFIIILLVYFSGFIATILLALMLNRIVYKGESSKCYEFSLAFTIALFSWFGTITIIIAEFKFSSYGERFLERFTKWFEGKD